MNLLQASIGHKVAAHFRRERRLMPRAFPVEILNDDQNTFVNDLIELFGKNNSSFDDDSFRTVCFNEEN